MLSTTFYGWAWKYPIVHLPNSSILVVLYNSVNESVQCQVCHLITCITSSLLENGNIYLPFTDWFLVAEQIKVLLMMLMILALRTTPVTRWVNNSYCLLLPLLQNPSLFPGRVKIIKYIPWLSSICDYIVGVTWWED